MSDMSFVREIVKARKTGIVLFLCLVSALASGQLRFSRESLAGHSDRYLGHAKAPLFAAAPPGKRDPGGFSARAADVLRGDLLVLEDGRWLRLAGVLAPLPEGQGRPPSGAWPGFEESRRALEALTFGKDLWAVSLGETSDRYGRSAVLLFDSQGRSLQEKLLEAGWLRLTGDHGLVEEFKKYAQLEARARAASRGLWAYRAYRIWTADEADKAIGRFGIVEGEVLSVAMVRKRLYLNFGKNWRDDFTVMIDNASQKTLAAAGIDPQSYDGRQLRIRGWIKSYNGAMIEVESPQQIEVLTP